MSRRARQQVALDDRKAVGVVHRQRRDRALLLPDFEVADDRARVRFDVAAALAHELGAARRPRGRQQQREVGVHGGRGLPPPEQRVALERKEALCPGEAPGHPLGQPEEAGPVGLQQAVEQLPVHSRVEQQRHRAARQEPRVAAERPIAVFAERKDERPPRAYTPRRGPRRRTAARRSRPLPPPRRAAGRMGGLSSIPKIMARPPFSECDAVFPQNLLAPLVGVERHYVGGGDRDVERLLEPDDQAPYARPNPSSRYAGRRAIRPAPLF